MGPHDLPHDLQHGGVVDEVTEAPGDRQVVVEALAAEVRPRPGQVEHVDGGVAGRPRRRRRGRRGARGSRGGRTGTAPPRSSARSPWPARYGAPAGAARRQAIAGGRVADVVTNASSCTARVMATYSRRAPARRAVEDLVGLDDDHAVELEALDLLRPEQRHLAVVQLVEVVDGVQPGRRRARQRSSRGGRAGRRCRSAGGGASGLRPPRPRGPASSGGECGSSSGRDRRRARCGWRWRRRRSAGGAGWRRSGSAREPDSRSSARRPRPAPWRPPAR